MRPYHQSNVLTTIRIKKIISMESTASRRNRNGNNKACPCHAPKHAPDQPATQYRVVKRIANRLEQQQSFRGVGGNEADDAAVCVGRLCMCFCRWSMILKDAKAERLITADEALLD